jgi:Tfp pilus assembly protein PilF
MDTHTGVIAFSIVAGGVSAVGTVWQFVIGHGPNVKQIVGRLLVLAACSGAIAYVLMTPAKSAKQPVTVSADAYYQKAKQFFDLHNRPDAEKEARQAILLEPSHKEAHKLLGACYGIDQNLDAAAAEYKEAVSIDPNDAEAELGLGMSLEGVGNKPEAKQAYHYVLLDPQSTDSQREIAHTRLRLLNNSKEVQ